MTDVIFDASEEKNKDVAETSKNSYKQLIDSGQLEGQKSKVLEALDAMPYVPSIDELSNEALAGWQKSTISGRINDLKDLGLIEMAGKRPSEYSGIKSKTWILTDKGESAAREVATE